MSKLIYEDMRPVFSGPKDDKYLDARSDYLACKSLQLNNFGIWDR